MYIYIYIYIFLLLLLFIFSIELIFFAACFHTKKYKTLHKYFIVSTLITNSKTLKKK